MIDLRNVKGGFLIENKLLFGANEIDNEYLNLAKVIGEDMRYERIPHVVIDYPGEYDIQGVGIKVFPGKDELLNYIININGKKIGVVQSIDFLEKEEVSSINSWLYTDDRILTKIEQMELEGEKVKLNTILTTD